MGGEKHMRHSCLVQSHQLCTIPFRLCKYVKAIRKKYDVL